MARGVKWGCSYQKATLIVCSINIVVALYVLCSLYSSLYVYAPTIDSDSVVRYTPDQIRKMEESVRIRKAHEPLKLAKLVKGMEEELRREETVAELPKEIKQRVTDEILQRLRKLNANASITEQREAVENWRKEKLQEVKNLTHGTSGPNSSILQEQTEMLARALKSDWALLLDNIGLWIPSEITNVEHDDKPEGEEEPEEEILPGRPVPPECHTELHADYAGAAVRWGLTHHKESAADCCQACMDQSRRAKPGEKKCNIWVYCPSETGCYSPDIYEHKNMECWLKYAENPKLNFKDRYSESYRNSHPKAPVIVPWVSGVIST